MSTDAQSAAALRNAFVAKDADSVARVALETLGPKESCMIFFGKVMEALAKGPSHPPGMPPADEAAATNDGKRKMDGAKETPDQAKRPKGGDARLDFLEQDIQDNPGSLNILLPSALVGSLIGKQGATIKSLSWAQGPALGTRAQKRCGAKVDVEKTTTFTETRLVSINGTLKQITLAAHLVIEACTLETVCLLVPNGICGLIIGKQGSNIKKLEKETGASLQMESSEHENCRKVLVSGENLHQCHAMYLIASLIAANENRIGVFDPRKTAGVVVGDKMQDKQAPGHYQTIAYTANPMNMQQRVMQMQMTMMQQRPQSTPQSQPMLAGMNASMGGMQGASQSPGMPPPMGMGMGMGQPSLGQQLSQGMGMGMGMPPSSPMMELQQPMQQQHTPQQQQPIGGGMGMGGMGMPPTMGQQVGVSFGGAPGMGPNMAPQMQQGMGGGFGQQQSPAGMMPGQQRWR